jgi:hypothetical protein
VTPPVTISKEFDKALLNVCIIWITTEWKEEEIKGIKFSRNKDIKTLLFADDHFTGADSEDELPISVHELETVTAKYGIKISKKEK